MIKEVCVENFTRIPEVIAKGANRIELCDNLSVGGTTVSYGVAKKSIEFCHSHDVKVMSIIRPRGGNFIYSKEEIEIMKEDLVQLTKLEIDGVVMGCLNEKNWIDEHAMLSLLELSQGLEVTFHMAFDEISPDRQFEAIDWLVDQGVHRILTHGGPSSSKIEQNLDILKEYINYAKGRIIILPGGGITNQNLEFISESLSISEVHGTKLV